ncbi:MAG: hypothetical protein WBC11_06560 [Dehalococcoidia bacterium]
MRHIIVPARSGSKGLPNKNHVLVPITASVVPKSEHVILSTDDEFLLKHYPGALRRSEENSSHTATMKETLIEIADTAGLGPQDDLVVLYPTYITRTWKDIESAWKMYVALHSFSLLCCYEAHTHPYMCIDEDGHKFIENSVYRRQELPPAFEYSHYIVILRANMLSAVDNQLMHPDTTYYHLPGKPVNVDGPDDLCEWSIGNKPR